MHLLVLQAVVLAAVVREARLQAPLEEQETRRIVVLRKVIVEEMVLQVIHITAQGEVVVLAQQALMAL